jgi:hypothetical protein
LAETTGPQVKEVGCRYVNENKETKKTTKRDGEGQKSNTGATPNRESDNVEVSEKKEREEKGVVHGFPDFLSWLIPVRSSWILSRLSASAPFPPCVCAFLFVYVSFVSERAFFFADHCVWAIVFLLCYLVRYPQ